MNVLVFDCGDLTGVLKNIAEDNEQISFLGVVKSVSELLKFNNLYKKLIVIIDLTSNEAIFEEISQFIQQKNLKIIAICKDMRHGFKYLNRGICEMLVAPNKDEIIGNSFSQNLILKIKKIYKEYDNFERTLKHKYSKKVSKIVAIGASTGGTDVILHIVKAFPKDMVPVLIVQHMPPVFTKMYSQRLNSICDMTVWEGKDGDELEQGLAIIAPGELQMRVELINNKYAITCKKEEPVEGHVPSVDVLFSSMAKVVNKNAIGVILTGMGRDGAQGLLNMRERGAFTIGQSEKSSMVYGMPKVAWEIGGVTVQSNAEKIAELIMEKV